MWKITFRHKVLTNELKLNQVRHSAEIRGTLMSLYKVKLYRKVAFLHFYYIESELFLYKPHLGVLSHDYTEDVLDKGHASVWLEINSLFENFVNFQCHLRILNIFDPLSKEYQTFNKIKTEK